MLSNIINKAGMLLYKTLGLPHSPNPLNDIDKNAVVVGATNGKPYTFAESQLMLENVRARTEAIRRDLQVKH